MKKPFYQVIIENAIPLIFFLTTLATAADTITHANRFLDYRMGLFLFGCTGFIYFLFIQRLEAGKIKWVTKEGHVVRLKKLGTKSEFFCLGIIAILATYTGYDFIKNGPLFKKQRQAEAAVFKTDDSYFKLLILPWQQECSYNGQQYDIGFVLKQRLENLNRKDTLQMRVVYLNNIVMSKNFTSDSAYALMRYHHANQILFGNQSLSQCEGGKSDKICYKYLTNSKDLGPQDMHARKDEYKMIDFHGYDDIRTGAGLESSDYVAYWVAAMSAMNKQNYPRAIRMFEKIQNYQKEEAVLFQISNCYMAMKDYTSERAYLEKVLAINPQHEEASLHIILILFKEGKTDQVRKSLEKLLAANPRDKSVLADLCLVYKQLKDTTGYNKYLASLQQVVPESHYRVWGEFHQKLGDFAKAKDYYEKALRSCSKHARDWSVLGEAYLHLKDTLKAKPYFIKALAIDSNYVTALCKMGILLQKEGDYKTAERYLQKSLRIFAYDEDALTALGKNYDKLGKKEQALACYEKALAIQPNQVFALIGAAVHRMELKNYDRSNKYLDRIISIYPNSATILERMAYLCFDKENYSQATIYYKRLLKLAPGNAAVLYNLASMSASQHDQDNALRYLSQALTAMPSLKTTAVKDRAFEEMRDTPGFVTMIR